MNKKEAINILIANAVCVCSKLHCDVDCPFYHGDSEECLVEDFDELLPEAVQTLRGEKK